MRFNSVSTLALIAVLAAGCGGGDEETAHYTFPGGSVNATKNADGKTVVEYSGFGGVTAKQTVTENGGNTVVDYEGPGGATSTQTITRKGDKTIVKHNTAHGTLEAEYEEGKVKMSGAGGATTIDTKVALTELGIALPDDAKPLNPKNPVTSISTPQGTRRGATVSTNTSPEDVLAFYAERCEVTTKRVIGDAAILAGKLDDGSRIDLSLTPLKNGQRTLSIMITQMKQ